MDTFPFARATHLPDTAPYRPRVDGNATPRPTEADAVETALLTAYHAHLQRAGHRTSRQRLTFADKWTADIDLVDHTTNELVFARHLPTYRSGIAALGEILDLRRAFPAAHPVLLVAERPCGQHLDLWGRADITAAWPNPELGFVHRAARQIDLQDDAAPAWTRRTLETGALTPGTFVEYTPPDGAPVNGRVGPDGWNDAEDGLVLRAKPHALWVTRADVDAGRVAVRPTLRHTARLAVADQAEPRKPGTFSVAWCGRCGWETPPRSSRSAARSDFARVHRQPTERTRTL